MPARVAKAVDEWNDRLISATQARYTYAVRHHHKSQNKWREALTLLQKCRKAIHIRKSGQHKGNVVNIPEKIDGLVYQTLVKIVTEEEAVLLPEHEGMDAANITEDKIVTGRSYRDSIYGVLAALWEFYKGPLSNGQPTDAVKRAIRKHTDHPVEFDHRTRRFGAWKGKDQLVKFQLVHESRGFGDANSYSLTLAGATACYHLFNNVFHPSRGPYAEVKPSTGHCTSNGYWYPTALEARRDAAFISDVSLSVHQARMSSNGLYINDGFLGNDDVTDNDHVVSGLIYNHRSTVGVCVIEDDPAPDPTTIRRRRLVAVDPHCKASISEYMSWGCDEEQSWLLYEQGNERAGGGSSSSSSSSSVPLDRVAVNSKTSEEDDLREAIYLSNLETHPDNHWEQAQSDNHWEQAQSDNHWEQAQSDNHWEQAQSDNHWEQAQSDNRWEQAQSDNHWEQAQSDNHWEQAQSDNDWEQAQSDNRWEQAQSDNHWEQAQSDNHWEQAQSDNHWEQAQSDKHWEHNAERSIISNALSLMSTHQNSSGIKSSSCVVRDSPAVVDLSKDSPDDAAERRLFAQAMSPLKRSFSAMSTICRADVVDLTGGSGGKEGSIEVKADKTQTDSDDQGRIAMVAPHCPIPRYEMHGLSPSAKLQLLVDHRERRRNSTYREFFTNIKGDMEVHAGIGVDDRQLVMGDFMLCFTSDDCSVVESTACLVVERKCLDDIISRSGSSVEGPHFSQERAMRNSQLPHAFLLIEGGIVDRPNLQPRVSAHDPHDLDDRLDVIRGKTDLLAYMCGIVCRNFGPCKVNVLHTSTISETTALLAALSVTVEHCLLSMSIPPLHPSFDSFKAHWRRTMRSAREGILHAKLRQVGISADMIRRIERRFGDEVSLRAAYSLCANEANRLYLLGDCSLAGSNFDEPAVALDDPMGKAPMILDGMNVLRGVIHEEVLVRECLLKSLKRQLVVNGSEEMILLNGDFIGFKHEVTVNKLARTRKEHDDELTHHRSNLWCEMYVQSQCEGFNRKSSHLYVLVVQGFDVIECLAEAYDVLSTTENYVPTHVTDKVFELKVVRRAWDSLRQRFPQVMTSRLQKEEEVDSHRHPQVVLLLDKLGRSGGNVGACGRLKTEHARAMHAAVPATDEVHNCGDVYSIHCSSASIRLDSSRRPISYPAATYLTSKLKWTLSLVTAVAQVELDYQVFGCSDAIPVTDMVTNFVNEMHRLALLPYEF